MNKIKHVADAALEALPALLLAAALMMPALASLA